MPVEIKELHIKAVIGAREKGAAAGINPEDIAKMKKEISKEVTEKVLRFLRQKNER